MNLFNWKLVALVGGFIATGCAPLGTGYGEYDPPPKPMEFAFDAVKLITPEIATEADPSTFEQSEYVLAPTRHLLMRFRGLPGHISQVRTDGSNKVEVQLIVLSDTGEAAASVKICPLFRHFMMFATWDAAHQFGTTGRWNRPGGDFDREGCVKGTSSSSDPRKLVFDVTRWFVDYPRARGVNYGLIATSSKPVTIAGDLSGGGYPRFLWSE